MRRRLIIVFAAFLLALITISAAPSLLTAQGQQAAPAPPQPEPQLFNQQQGGQQGGRGGQGAQGGRGGRGNQPAVPSEPTPRWPDGHPRMGALPDEKGIWGACCGGLSNATTPFQEWSKEIGRAHV